MRVALAVVLTTSYSTCHLPGGSGSHPPADPPPLYDCESMFDDGCRFEAEVTWTTTRLSDATITWGNGLSESSATLDDVQATVVLRDTLGVHPDVTCAADTSLQFDSVYENQQYDVEVWADPSTDCPVTCAWFLPTSGAYDANEGRFGIGYFEGYFDFQWGPYDTDPSYSAIMFEFQLADSSFDIDGGEIELLEPTTAYPTTYRVPMALSGSNTVGTCDP